MAIGALDEIALGTREEVDDKPDEAGEEDEEHPENTVVEAAGLGVTGDPDEQQDVEDDDDDGDEEEGAAEAAGGDGRSSIGGVLGEGGGGAQGNSGVKDCEGGLPHWESLGAR